MMIRSSVVMTLALSRRLAFSVAAGLAAVSGASGVGCVLVIETTAGKMSCSILIGLGLSLWLSRWTAETACHSAVRDTGRVGQLANGDA